MKKALSIGYGMTDIEKYDTHFCGMQLKLCNWKVTQRMQNILAKHHNSSYFILFKIQLMVKISNWNGGLFKIFGSFFFTYLEFM